jgi:hypothetical protein
MRSDKVNSSLEFNFHFKWSKECIDSVNENLSVGVVQLSENADEIISKLDQLKPELRSSPALVAVCEGVFELYKNSVDSVIQKGASRDASLLVDITLKIAVDMESNLVTVEWSDQGRNFPAAILPDGEPVDFKEVLDGRASIQSDKKDDSITTGGSGRGLAQFIEFFDNVKKKYKSESTFSLVLSNKGEGAMLSFTSPIKNTGKVVASWTAESLVEAWQHMQSEFKPVYESKMGFTDSAREFVLSPSPRFLERRHKLASPPPIMPPYDDNKRESSPPLYDNEKASSGVTVLTPHRSPSLLSLFGSSGSALECADLGLGEETGFPLR